MERTTIMLPHDLKLLVTQHARKQGISMGELIRNAIITTLSQAGDKGDSEDPLFSDTEIFRGYAPADLSTNHDGYLYGEK